MMHTLPQQAQEAIRDLLDQERRAEVASHQADATVTMPAVPAEQPSGAQADEQAVDPTPTQRVEPS
jgi:hypothetical protein